MRADEGYRKRASDTRQRAPRPTPRQESLPLCIKRSAEPLPSIAEADLDGLIERIGDARLVLLGEASHGSAEFYEMRARISKELITRKAFDFIAVEADWPDASQIDHYVRASRSTPTPEQTFCRFPNWMWVNRQVWDFLSWLRNRNDERREEEQVGFFGLDLYSLYTSIDAVIAYLDEVSEKEAALARQRYACFNIGERDPARYGRMAMSPVHGDCEEEVVAMLARLLNRQLDYMQQDGRRFLDAVANARLIKNAERYYRAMYQVDENVWNLRDRHMMEMLNTLLDHHGVHSKAIVWAHNSHLGNAAATEMSSRGEINVGQLCREQYADDAYLIGFGTDRGTVAAASDWGAAMEIKRVRPSHEDSYERLCHDSGLGAFLLPIRSAGAELRRKLEVPRLERAIGVIYRPETERASHYFKASLPRQFDEYVWFDETRAVEPLTAQDAPGLPENFPFGLSHAGP